MCSFNVITGKEGSDVDSEENNKESVPIRGKLREIPI